MSPSRPPASTSILRNPEDFLQAVGSVVYALHNDFEEASRFIEEGITAPPKSDKTT